MKLRTLHVLSRVSRVCGFSLIIFACLSLSALAQDRSLGTLGDEIEFTIDPSEVCSEEATINILATRADLFEQDDEAIQNWSDSIREIFGYECEGQIQKLKYKGFTDDVEVFSADTNADVQWLIQSEPAPLERFALFFNLKEPDLFNFGALYSLFKPYEAVPEIKKTIQYAILEKQLIRLSSAVNGDLEEFQTYLESAGPGVPNFEFIKKHHDTLMEAIQAFQPSHYDGYLMTYLSNLQSLKEKFWAAQASEIIDDYSLSLAQLFDVASEKVMQAESEEFTQYMDKQLAAIVNDEFNVLSDELLEATLLEANYIADFLTDTPDTDATALFPASSALLNIYPDDVLGLLNERIEELTLLAIETINESGYSYVDTDQIMEAGFALAGEFDESGFVDESERLILHTIEKVNSVLSDDLPGFKQEMMELQLDDQIASELQNQSNIYRELSTQFEGFSAYQDIVDQKLVDDRDQICESLMFNASIESKLYEKSIRLFDQDRMMIRIACELYDNGNTLLSFENDNRKQLAQLAVALENGGEALFVLSSEESNGAHLMPVSATIENSEVGDSLQAQEELLRLVEASPDGKPDASGIRQCDRMVGDPEDPAKLSVGLNFNDDDLDPRDFDRAIDACIAAVEDDPNDPRSQYQLGRVLTFVGDEDTANEYFELAAEQKYAAALHFKAEYILTSSESQNDFVDALNLFEEAGNAGYQPSVAMINELNPDGIEFYKEIPAPTESEIASIFTKRNCVNGGMLFTVCAKQRGARLRNCMQTSAVNFECEYRVNVYCENGNNFFQQMAAGACRNAVVDWHFGRFTKQRSGWGFERIEL